MYDVVTRSGGLFDKPLPMFLLQLIIIISVARVSGALFRKINQPSVIGEIFAGILLGPSILGIFAPEIFHFIFPPGVFSV